MERLIILVGRLYKSVTPTNLFFKVPLVGRFMPLVGGIGRLVEPHFKHYCCYLLNIKAVLCLNWSLHCIVDFAQNASSPADQI